MMNKGSNVLDGVLQFRKVVRDLRGIDFKHQSLDKQGESSMTNFVLSKMESKPVMSEHLTQHHARHQNSQTEGKLLHWRCHYYGKYGHINPLCFKLYGYPRYPIQTIDNQKKEWIPKPINTSVITHISFRASA